MFLNDSTLQDINRILSRNGHCVLNDIYTNEEIGSIIEAIERTDTLADTFRKSDNLFAIRQFLKEVPDAFPLIFNARLKEIIEKIGGSECFVVKSIYFDKPGESNWFVAYHQDLTISVNEKSETPGYGPWTVKQGQFAVQPPLDILENIFTLRIHLDDTDEDNGALKVIESSHNKGIYRPETIDWNKETQVSCSVARGGVMVMKPLLLHSSSRTINNARRRVIHIEFSSIELPEHLQWAERISITG